LQLIASSAECEGEDTEKTSIARQKGAGTLNLDDMVGFSSPADLQGDSTYTAAHCSQQADQHTVNNVRATFPASNPQCDIESWF
jgi:hypothetical protein